MTIQRIATLSLFVAAGLLAIACVTGATDDELTKMCNNLVKLRGEVDASTLEEMTAAIKERYEKEEKRLKDWKERDLKGWDDELNAKLAATEDEAEKAKLTEEYTKKKEVTASKHDPGIQELPKKREAALEAAKKKVVENQARWDKAVKACVEEAKKEGVSKKVATCRISATSSDQYWNSCR